MPECWRHEGRCKEAQRPCNQKFGTGGAYKLLVNNNITEVKCRCTWLHFESRFCYTKPLFLSRLEALQGVSSRSWGSFVLFSGEEAPILTPPPFILPSSTVFSHLPANIRTAFTVHSSYWGKGGCLSDILILYSCYHCALLHRYLVVFTKLKYLLFIFEQSHQIGYLWWMACAGATFD